MAFTIGRRSRRCLDTCDKGMVKVFELALSRSSVDFGCTYGHRGKAKQNSLVEAGYSRVVYPNSDHNKKPSMAYDLAPYIPKLGLITGNAAQIKELSIKYKKSEAWIHKQLFALYGLMAGYVIAAAMDLGEPVYWGNDWDMDGNVFDTNFVDPGHFFKKVK